MRFRSLTEDDIEQVLDIQLRQLETRMAERKLTLEVSEDARRWLARRGYDPHYGARPLKRLIQHAIVDPLALELLSGVYRDGDCVSVDVAGDEVIPKWTAAAVLRLGRVAGRRPTITGHGRNHPRSWSGAVCPRTSGRPSVEPSRAPSSAWSLPAWSPSRCTGPWWQRLPQRAAAAGRRRGHHPAVRRRARRAASPDTGCGWLTDACRAARAAGGPGPSPRAGTTRRPPIPADRILDAAARVAELLLDVQTRVNGQIDAALAELLPGVRQQLGIAPANAADLSGLVNTRITGLSVVVTPAAVATVVPLSAESAATTRAGRRAVTDIVTGADDRLAVIAGPCSIHDPEAALEYAAFLVRMRKRHGDDLEILMRTYTEKPRTEVDWKGFAYDPFLDGSSRISVGLVATRMLMGRITALGVPVAAEPLNALTPQYVNGLVTYNGVGARNVTDQTARERVSGFSSVVGFKNSPEGSIDAAVSAVLTARAPHEFLGVDHHGVSAQLSTTGNDTAHVILRGDKDGPNYSAAHIAGTKRKLAQRGLPEVVVVDASHGNSQKDHRRQVVVVQDLAGQVAAGERAIRGVMVESNLVAGRQDLDREHPERLEYGVSVTDACVDLDTTEAVLAELAEAVRARRGAGSRTAPAPR